MTKRNDYKCTRKDIAFIVIFILLAVAQIIYHIRQNGFSSIGTFIEQAIIIILAFVGLLEIFHYAGWDVLVPDFMLIAKRASYLEDLQECMNEVVNNSMDDILKKALDEYFRKEYIFLQDSSEDRTSYIMTQLGVTLSQFQELRVELTKMRCLPLKDLEDAKGKMKQLIKCKPFVADLERIDAAKRTYTCVNYYLNFNDTVYFTDICRELVAIMQKLILSEVSLSSFDKIVIPHDSNLVLGIELGKQLGKPVVHMRKKEGRIEKEKCWDGDLKPTDKVIIVHDVLVTSAQIRHALDNLPKTCEKIGLFCLVSRKEYTGVQDVEKRGVPVSQILPLSDDDIKEILNS